MLSIFSSTFKFQLRGDFELISCHIIDTIYQYINTSYFPILSYLYTPPFTLLFLLLLRSSSFNIAISYSVYLGQWNSLFRLPLLSFFSLGSSTFISLFPFPFSSFKFGTSVAFTVLCQFL